MAIKNRPTQLNGINPLSYVGVNPYTPPAMYQLSRPPTVRDNAGFQIGDFWMNETNNDLWYLAKKSNPPQYQDALWVLLNNGADLETLTGDVGGPVGPDANRNIDTLGTAGEILVTGTPGTNTLTWSLDGSVATSYPTDAGTAIPAAGVLNVFGGTAGRDINTTGAGNTVRVELNNAITLGDLSNITGSAALTATTGDVTITAGNLNISGTNAAGTIGVVVYANERFISNFGTLNTFIGGLSGNFTVTGTQNTGVGRSCLRNITSGTNNNAFGLTAGLSITTGSNNALLGQSGVFVTTGSDNTMVGHESGCNVAGVTGVLTGSNNVLLGSSSGDNYTGAESNNIIIGAFNGATAGESNKCRIGSGTGAGVGQLDKTFIHGIRGITTDVNDAIAVLIDSAGQLGTVSSSIRYKENVIDMDDYSSGLLELRPVTFNYKDRPGITESGLIAEEVAEVLPELVVYKDGQPETVKYHLLVNYLINELQKLEKRVTELESK